MPMKVMEHEVPIQNGSIRSTCIINDHDPIL